MLFVAVKVYIRTIKGNLLFGTVLFSRVPYLYEKLKINNERFFVIDVCHYAKSRLNSARSPVARVIVIRY